MKVFKLAAGLAIGYVLGSRAGRDKYDQIAAAARKAQTHPAVTQAQQKARELIGSASPTLSTGDEAPTVPVPADTTSTADEAPAVPVPADTTSPGPVPRPPRRQPKTTVTAPDLTADPLA